MNRLLPCLHTCLKTPVKQTQNGGSIVPTWNRKRVLLAQVRFATAVMRLQLKHPGVFKVAVKIIGKMLLLMGRISPDDISKYMQ